MFYMFAFNKLNIVFYLHTWCVVDVAKLGGQSVLKENASMLPISQLWSHMKELIHYTVSNEYMSGLTIVLKQISRGIR